MKRRLVLCAMLVALSASVWAQNQRWEIVPEQNPDVPVGKTSVIGGQTTPDGVRFVINNLDIMQPIEIALATDDASKPLTLSVYKDAPAQALLEHATDAGGVYVAKFRTADSVQLQVKGPAGAKYQLMAWVGPPIEVPTPSALVPIDAQGVPLAAGVTLTPPANAGGTAPAQTAANTLQVPASVTILLGLILVALVVIIVVLMRRGGKAKGTAAAIAFVLLLGGQRPGRADIVPSPIDVAPKKVTSADTWKQTNDALQKLREMLEKMEKDGIKTDPDTIKVNRPTGKSEGGPDKATPFDAKKTAGQYVTSMKLLLDFMEEFGLIDPREAAVQPNYNPPGQPLIPSHCAGTEACGACFKDANAKLDKSRKLLEDMYVIYKQTELKTGRIMEMANAAAGLSPYAQMLWAAQKANPNEGMNVAQKHFYDVYDTNLGKLLQMANEGLIGVAACERENFKDYDWYPRYGMIYYNFLQARYTRK
jgi:hypothetical protein